RARVVALEVDGLHRTRLHQLGDQRLAPGASGVELEAQSRVGVQAPADRVHAGWLAQAQRNHEANRLRRPSERFVQRCARLAQRKVERRRLVCPYPIAPRNLALGLLWEQVELRHALAKRAYGPAPTQWQVWA